MRILQALLTMTLAMPHVLLAQTNCNTLPNPFGSERNDPNGLACVACPAGDIPCHTGICSSPETDDDIFRLIDTQDYAYEFTLCPELPTDQDERPSIFGRGGNVQPCASDFRLCSVAVRGGGFTGNNVWCWRFLHSIGTVGACLPHTDYIPMRVPDANGTGAVDAGDLSAMSAFLGKQCDTYYAPPATPYSPIMDFVPDCIIDMSDLAYFSQHFGHKCPDWKPLYPEKASDFLASLPWHIFDLPQMQEAMRIAGTTREWIVDFWMRNGPENRLGANGQAYNRESHLANSQLNNLAASVQPVRWSVLKTLYR